MNAVELTEGCTKNFYMLFFKLGSVLQIVCGMATPSELDFQDKPSYHLWLVDAGNYFNPPHHNPTEINTMLIQHIRDRILVRQPDSEVFWEC